MTQDSEWIPWPGGECPVATETLVEVRFDDPLNTERTYAARSLRWTHRNGNSDIIAYRIVEQQP